MDTIRSVIGLSKPESGKEPVNGETGTGTATEPYDAGNQEENPPSTAAHTTKTATATATEPLNGTTGAGTATEPYDAGNQEENQVTGVPDKSEAPTSAIATSSAAPTSSTAEPLEHTDPKEGTVPTSDASKTTATTSPDPEAKPSSVEPSVAPEKSSSTPQHTLAEDGAAQWSGDTTEGSTDKTATSKSAIGATAAASGAAIGTAAAASGSKSEPASAATSKTEPTTSSETKEMNKTKEPTIGSASWFRNALGRRKSKTPTSTTEADRAKVPATVTEHEKPKESKDVVAAAPIEPLKSAKTETQPIENKSAPIIAPVETAETKPATTDKTAAEPKPKKERSHSRDFKLFKGNPFKRNSQVETDDEKLEDSTKTSKKPAVAAAAVAGAGGAALAKETETEKAKESTAAKEEPQEPNHLSSEVPKGTAEPAAPGELPPIIDSAVPAAATSAAPAATAKGIAADDDIAPDQTTSKAVHDDDIAPDQMTSKAVHDDDIAPDQTTSKAVHDDDIAPDQTTSKAVDDEDIAPDHVAPHSKKDPVAETDAPTRSEGLSVPAINEPATDPSEDKGKGHATGRRPSHNAGRENLSAIPTAGGIRLGEKAMEERQTSTEFRRQSMAPPTDNGSAAPKASTPSNNKALPATPDKATSETKSTPGLKRRASVFDKLKAKLKM